MGTAYNTSSKDHPQKARNEMCDDERCWLTPMQYERYLSMDAECRALRNEMDALKVWLREQFPDGKAYRPAKKKKPTEVRQFVAPTLEEVKAHLAERDWHVDAQEFIDFYASKGWKVGDQPMKSWESALSKARKWETSVQLASTARQTARARWQDQDAEEQAYQRRVRAQRRPGDAANPFKTGEDA